VWPMEREGQEVVLRHETSTWASDWPEFGHGNTVAGHDKSLSGHYGIDYVSVVVSQLSLGNGLCHVDIVAQSATKSYGPRGLNQDESGAMVGWPRSQL
jgi:hypothetical protein